MWRNQVCIFSLEDLPDIVHKNHFIANKFLLEYDPISYQCMEELLDYKVKEKPIINMNFYCQFISKNSFLTKCF